MRRFRIVRLAQTGQNVRDYVASRLRTLVPVAWGAGLTWLAQVIPGISDWLNDPAMTTVGIAVAGAVTTLWYDLWARVQDKIPAWLRTLTLGHPATPDSYSPPEEAPRLVA